VSSIIRELKSQIIRKGITVAGVEDMRNKCEVSMGNSERKISLAKYKVVQI
jgi:hypothetical protein